MTPSDAPVSRNTRSGGRHRVVIGGGGVAGLEALLGLHELARDRVHLTLVDPRPEFIYKPQLVEEPFALGPAERHELAPIAKELGARFILGAIRAVEPQSAAVELEDGSRISYDSLVVCVGASGRPAFQAATTFPRPDSPFRIDELLGRSEGPLRIAFVVPSGVTWALPIYELALMTERRARDLHRSEVECVIVTPEAAPLIMFGPAASDAVTGLLAARGIECESGAYVRESDSGVITLCPADRELGADAIVAMPLLEGPALPGLPSDDGGFIPIDGHARVAGAEGVYAAGDGANFPIKQGGIGTQQADAAVEHIARRAGADVEPQPFHPVLRGMLLTGAGSMHMRHAITGCGGEGAASSDYLWWPPHKIASRYLSAWLAHEDPRQDPEPPRIPLDVEVALPSEWHEDPMLLDPYLRLGRDSLP